MALLNDGEIKKRSKQNNCSYLDPLWYKGNSNGRRPVAGKWPINNAESIWEENPHAIVEVVTSIRLRREQEMAARRASLSLMIGVFYNWLKTWTKCLHMRRFAYLVKDTQYSNSLTTSDCRKIDDRVATAWFLSISQCIWFLTMMPVTFY